MRTPSKLEKAVAVLFFCLTTLWILVRLPTPLRALKDSDGGHQLAGAIQILHGEVPFVDYHATYGPLTFYASAFAQLVFDDRLVGEYVLLTLGYAFAYALLAHLIYRLTGDFRITLLFGILALAAIPRLYKYYLVLGPVLTLLATWNYLEKPNQHNTLWMALAITVTGLFRADFGVYCAIACLVAILKHPVDKQGRLARACILLGAILILALPWLFFLALRGGLLNYFSDSVIGGANIAIGMSLPFPGLHPRLSILSQNNLEFFAAVFFFAIPVIMFIWLSFRWSVIAPVQKQMLLVASTFSLFSLIQASHRADYLHLLQTIPIAFLLTAWMAKQLGTEVLSAFREHRKVWFAYGLAWVVLLGFVSIPVLLYKSNGWPPIDLSGLYSKLAQASLPKQQFLDKRGAQADSFYAQTMLYIRRCTTDRQRLMALPALTTFYYFTDRSFGGGQIGVLSGYFVTGKDQARIVRTMSAQDIPLIVYVPNLVFDGIPERQLEVVAPMVAEYIRENYTQIKKIGPASLMMRDDLRIDRPADKLVDMSCPHP